MRVSVRAVVLAGFGAVALPVLLFVLVVFGPFAWVFLGFTLVAVSTVVRLLRGGDSAAVERATCDACGADVAAALDRCPHCDEPLPE
ncbi:hypothetical protein [Halegenticoccus tardaugens]|uniref:hypothetical protein n=1 Tax=Halegenticoccus tardaugens TaxID=2071624 RepID=UPI00100B9F7C|nr:hypothetical protein [Halegenticoccus tardaugens]